jgi:hypothetical protein
VAQLGGERAGALTPLNETNVVLRASWRVILPVSSEVPVTSSRSSTI